MPAARSRTDRWRESLHQIATRGGGLELSVERAISAAPAAPDLVWRVRLLGIKDGELLVEQPAALGHAFSIDEGTTLVAVMAVGQNRWMFKTRVVGRSGGASPFGRLNGLRIVMPSEVERCARRDFLRVSTAELRLPAVEVWPLLEPSSVVAAEVANRAQIADLERNGGLGAGTATDLLLPEVGPKFSAKLMNVGGGGVGLLVEREDAAAAERARLVWMRINLMPRIPAPLGVTAKLVHSHLDSGQNLYVGAAFEFAFHLDHRAFVIDQISRCLSRIQAERNAA